MGLFDRTTHFFKREYTTLFGTPKAETYCGRTFEISNLEPGPDKPGWIASCSGCQRKKGVKM